MDKEVAETEKRISIEELEEEDLTHKMSIAEKKARIRELKQGGWGGKAKEVVKWIKSMKVDKETARSLYGEFSGLRDYNDPRSMRR